MLLVLGEAAFNLTCCHAASAFNAVLLSVVQLSSIIRHLCTLEFNFSVNFSRYRCVSPLLVFARYFTLHTLVKCNTLFDLMQVDLQRFCSVRAADA